MTPPTTEAMQDLLRVRYPAETHAMIFEARNAAGFQAERSCDAIAVGTWPSRGLKVSGFEIKRTRSDWLAEYRNPKKADAFIRYCDEWYLVVADAKIVHADELPESWGLLVYQGSRFKLSKPAPKLTPQPMDRSFLAALLKKALQQGPSAALLEKTRTEAAEQAVKHLRNRETHALAELNKLTEKVRAFEDASGIQVRDTWTAGKDIGAAVKAVLAGTHKPHMTHLHRLLAQSKSLVTVLEGMTTEVPPT